MEEGSVGTPTKEALREYFAIHEDSELSVSDVAAWLDELGTCTRKKDIRESARALTEYMIEVKGYTTGEDFTTATEGDIEEARVNAKLSLTDVSLRTIYRYMTAAVAKQSAKEAAGSPRRSETTTTTTTSKTEEALMNCGSTKSTK